MPSGPKTEARGLREEIRGARVRAAVLSEVGGGLVIERVHDPQPGADEVLISVSSCGVCHTDLHVMRGEVTFPLPAVLGHEISGTVVALGDLVHELKVGDRVVSSFIMPCGHCRRCAQGEDDLCETFFSMNRLRGTLYDGETRLYRENGEPLWMYSMAGLAEACVVPSSAVFPIPATVAMEDVATLGCSALTAYGAVRNVSGVRPGDSVAVVAAGGIGLAIVQMLAIFGAGQIIVVDVADEKLEMATRLGATAVVNASELDPSEAVWELTRGKGVDVAFEAFGSATTFQTAIRVVGDHGKVVVVGIAPSGVVGEIDLTRLPRRKLQILGSYGGRPRTDMPRLLDLVARGKFLPQEIVSRRFALADADHAYRALGRGEIIGRAVVDM